jgi:hypothetical protein
MTDNNNDNSHLRRASESMARRDFLAKGGKFAFFGAMGTTLAKFLLEPAGAYATSPGCGTFSPCGCQGRKCIFVKGGECAPRTGDCPGGGQCWATAGGLVCCDWFCSGNACRCCA